MQSITRSGARGWGLGLEPLLLGRRGKIFDDEDFFARPDEAEIASRDFFDGGRIFFEAARFLAHVVGKAHARQMDDATRRRWYAELGRNRSQTLDAPSWLWSSIVALVVSHEAAYLEHCRRYALGVEAA